MSTKGSFNPKILQEYKLLILLQRKLWREKAQFGGKKTLSSWFVYFRKIMSIENCGINLIQCFEESLDFKILFVPRRYISKFNIFSLASSQHVSIKLYCLAPTLDCENFRRDWERLFDKCHSENSISRKWLVILKTTSENLRFIRPTQKSPFETSHLVLNMQYWIHSEKYQRKNTWNIIIRAFAKSLNAPRYCRSDLITARYHGHLHGGRRMSERTF